MKNLRISRIFLISALLLSACACSQNPANPTTSDTTMPNHSSSAQPMSQFPVQVPFDAAKANQTASVDFWISPPPNYGPIQAEIKPNWLFYINLSSPYSQQSDALSTVEKLSQQKRPIYRLRVYRIDTKTPQLQPLRFANTGQRWQPATSDLFFPSPISWGAEERDYALAYLILPRNQVGHYRAEVVSTVDTPELMPFPFKFSVDLGPAR